MREALLQARRTEPAIELQAGVFRDKRFQVVPFPRHVWHPLTPGAEIDDPGRTRHSLPQFASDAFEAAVRLFDRLRIVKD
jgi:hypothetical protein